MVQSLLRAAALALAVGLALPASAQAPAAADDPVVAKVNNEVIHRSEVANVIAGLPEQYRAYPADALFGAVLGQMIDQRLMAEAAEAAKLADDPGVKRRIALARDSVLQQAYISREVEKGLTDERLKAAYAKRMKEEPPQEEVHARHILVKTEAEAKELIVELQKGADFATLAKSKSTDAASNQDGGDLGYFTKDRMVPEFAEAAFAMKPGEISKTPVQTKFGWHVIKVEDRREGPTFDDAKEELRGEVAKQLIAETIQRLRANAKVVQFNQDGTPLKSSAPKGPADSK